MTSASQDLLQKLNIPTLIQEVIDASFHQYQDVIKYILKTDKVPEVVTYAALVRIILYELISNAIIYRKESEPESYVAIEAYQDHATQQLIMLVNDNGSGIPLEIQKEIFSMFKRGHSYSSGSGLGLYIVKSALDVMHGKITIIPKTTPGTLFRIEFGQEVKNASPVEI
jgi:signal transduction histidine kinase